MDKYLDFDLPAELICQPQPLIAFVGLDIQNNAIHKTIWEMFSVNRHQDRPAIKFVLFPLEFSLPISKPKVNLPRIHIAITLNELLLNSNFILENFIRMVRS